MIFEIATYSVFLDSPSIVAVDDINKAEGIWKVINYIRTASFMASLSPTPGLSTMMTRS